MESNNKKLLAYLAVLIVIMVIVGGVVVTKKSESNTSSSESVTTTMNSNDESSASTNQATNSTYKDGTYTASGSYSSPGGQESISVKVTLQDGTVTETSATAGATDKDAEEYQEKFINNYQQLVVGKKIDGIRLSRVAGSSLTSTGFNNALEQIKEQAQI